jgi:hypothetical protein
VVEEDEEDVEKRREARRFFFFGALPRSLFLPPTTAQLVAQRGKSPLCRSRLNDRYLSILSRRRLFDEPYSKHASPTDPLLLRTSGEFRAFLTAIFFFRRLSTRALSFAPAQVVG